MAEQQNAKQQNAKEPDLTQLLKVRREKLAELQAAGKDPFQITKYDVTVHSEDVKVNYAEYEGKEVSIAGRMMSKRGICIRKDAGNKRTNFLKSCPYILTITHPFHSVPGPLPSVR